MNRSDNLEVVQILFAQQNDLNPISAVKLLAQKTDMAGGAQEASTGIYSAHIDGKAKLNSILCLKTAQNNEQFSDDVKCICKLRLLFLLHNFCITFFSRKIYYGIEWKTNKVLNGDHSRYLSIYTARQ